MRRAFRLRFAQRHLEQEVDEEIAFHIEKRTQSLIERGWAPDAARVEALRQFGSTQSIRTECLTLDQEREIAMHRATMFSDVTQDASFATRTLRRNPGFTLVALATLALGIGANTAVFALIDAVMLRNLNVRDPQELVIVGNPTRANGLSTGDPRVDLLPNPIYTRARERLTSFSGLAAMGRAPRLFMTTDGQSQPENPRGRFVSANFFSVLGVTAQIGRTFGTEEDRGVGASSAVVISDEYWRRRFEGDRAVVGRSLTINGAPVRIVGVTPPGFIGEVMGSAYDIWMPLTLQPLIQPGQGYVDDPQASWLVWLGRRKPGVTLEQARADLATVVPPIFVEVSNADWYLRQARDIKGSDLMVSDGSRGMSRTRAIYSGPLLTLMAGVGLLMLIVCANVANLLLARATARAREMNLRVALGAGRWRVIRQLLTESTVLAVTGAAVGLLVGYWGSQLLLAIAADGGPSIPVAIGLQGRVAVFAVAVSLIAVIIFGLAPAVVASRVNLSDAMRASSRSIAGSSVRGLSPARLVIAAQVALSLLLLVGAGLLVRSMWALQSAEMGMDRDHLLIVDVESRVSGYVGARFPAFTDEMRQRLAQVPGVVSVSFSENGLFNGTDGITSVRVEGYTAGSAQDSVISVDQVGPGYATALGARIIEGRDLDDRDRGPNATEVLINQTAARAWFPGTNAVGKWIRIDTITTYRVAGVITDAQDHDLKAKPVRRVYFPHLASDGNSTVRFIVRTKGDPALAAPGARRAVEALDPKMPILAIESLPLILRGSIRAERLVAKLAIGFGLLALALAAIGLYGVMSYAVSRRTNEIGVRVALGAQRRDVVTMIVGDSLRTVALGLVGGLGLSLYLTRFLASQLHGVEPVDVASISVAIVVLLATGVIATLVPALRGARIAPVEALRDG